MSSLWLIVTENGSKVKQKRKKKKILTTSWNTKNKGETTISNPKQKPKI